MNTVKDQGPERLLGAIKRVGTGSSSTPREKKKAMGTKIRREPIGDNPDTTTSDIQPPLPATRAGPQTPPPPPPPSPFNDTETRRAEPRGEASSEERPQPVRSNILPAPQRSRMISITNPGDRSNLDYSSYENRIDSFKNWPKSMTQTPASLADAGLYYLGAGDKVRCFSCNGQLDNWAAQDEPWHQHAYWYAKCRYVIARKGTEYVRGLSYKTPVDVSLADTMACYRSYCQKTIKPAVIERTPLQDYEKAALMECIPTGFVAPGTRLDDIVFENLCRYCGMRRVGRIYVPCTHTVACYQCAQAATRCDLCNEDILFVKNIVIIPDRPYSEYEHVVSPMMIQEANDLTRATIRTLQALGKK